MAHVGLSFASFLEQNSRARSPARKSFYFRAGKRPALANVRASIFLCKKILGQVNGVPRREAEAVHED
jgi:hypothetical protein